MVNALALKVLGAGATSFGPGPDAGRDGWFEGEAPYPSADQRWKGIWYIQAKFHAPHLSKDPQKWLLAQVRSEIAAFSGSDSKREWPDNWILATNVDPSGAGSLGTFDKARKLVETARPKLAERFHIWGGQKLCHFLDEYPHVARRFGHFLTPGHVLAALFEQLGDERVSVEDLVRYSVLRGIEDQRQTRLEQAGSSEDRRPGIDALFVDLPFRTERCNVTGTCIETLAHASACNHQIDGQEPTNERWKTWRARPGRAAVWFVRAGPGRGKSSIGQFFCQVQRAALILQPSGLAVHPDIRELAKRIRAKAQAVRCWPSVPRVPLWVELKAYAAWFGEQGAKPHGIASYLSAMLHRYIETPVTVNTIRRALKQRSWVIVFDGLDEVPSDVKDAVASEVVSFVRDTAVSADILSICTSRPQGYAGQFDALDGAVVDLIDLPPDLALECALKVASADRSTDDADRARALLQRAIESPAVRELMTTPLQAHIMAVLVRNGQRPPERKWDLYQKFYEVIREREANRELPDPMLRELFQRDPALIDTVHQRLGFALHTRAERASGADASLTKIEFRLLVEGVVNEVRSSPDVSAIVNALLSATTERLVLISTPDQGDRVRFDLRAIQEFFAAEFLYVDTPADILRERLELIAGDAHWREVVQFVLGALTALKRATEWTVTLEVLRAVDAGGRDEAKPALARRLANGALHAALFLENGAAENSRKTRDQLKPLLEPIAHSSDPFLFNVLKLVSSPESRAWVQRWAEEEVRISQPSGARGVIRILAAQYVQQEKFGDMQVLLDGLPTTEAAELLTQFDYYLSDPQDAQKDHSWFDAAESHLLTRRDCISAAPRFVRDVLWAACPKGLNDTLHRKLGEKSIKKKLAKLFADPVEKACVGIVTTELHLARGSRAVLAGSQSGLLEWLMLLHDVADNVDVARTIDALSWLGRGWSATSQLPEELRRNLPIPADARIAPATVSSLLRGMTPEELKKCLDVRDLKGIRLNPGASTILLRFAEMGQLEATIDELLVTDPELAWLLWSAWPEESVRQRPNERLKRALADVLERDPLILLNAHSSLLLDGLAELGDNARRVMDAVERLDLSWSLSCEQQVRRPSHPIVTPVFQLPRDSVFLTPIAEAFISTAVSALQHSKALKMGALRKAVDQQGLTIEKLVQAIHSEHLALDERAAAVLLAGLHPRGGWAQLADARDDCLEFARNGLPIAAGVAVVIEVGGWWSDDSAGQLINDLLEASTRSEPAALRARRDGGFTINAVTRVWRERSSAPMTTVGAMTRWLGLSDTSPGAIGAVQP